MKADNNGYPIFLQVIYPNTTVWSVNKPLWPAAWSVLVLSAIIIA